MPNPVYDPQNQVVKRCAEGMEAEGRGDQENAARLFGEAWLMAGDPMEKFTAAHFLARHQPGPEHKLHWDLLALSHALLVPGDSASGSFASLYLNIGKCYEDLGNPALAEENYLKAESHTRSLGNDGYGRMISSGIAAGLARLKNR